MLGNSEGEKLIEAENSVGERHASVLELHASLSETGEEEEEEPSRMCAATWLIATTTHCWLHAKALRA